MPQDTASQPEKDAVVPASPRRLLAFCDSAVRGRSGLARKYLQTMPVFDGFKRNEAASQGVRISQLIADTPEGRRAVLPFYTLGYQVKRTAHPVNLTEIFERGEIDVTKDVEALAQLGDRLSQRGITLDLVYFDSEAGLSPWEQGMEPIQEMYRSGKAREKLPGDVRDVDVKSLRFGTPEYKDWMVKFCKHADDLKAQALRKVAIESGLLSPWGARTMAANFYTIRTSFPVYDLNGWKMIRDSLVDTRTSCPVCTLSPKGGRYADHQHDRYWNSFIDLVNHARSTGACGPILPVIREPQNAQGQARGTLDPGGKWMMDQLIGHLVRAGASRFMCFHPYFSEADDEALAELMEKHEAALPLVNPVLPEIRLDVDEVVTGDWRTTYEDFLAQRPERWVAQE